MVHAPRICHCRLNINNKTEAIDMTGRTTDHAPLYGYTSTIS